MKAACTAEVWLDVARFETGAFDPAGFGHASHVRVAWCYLQECDLAEATRRFSRALRSLTGRLGMPEKYHETITLFFMFLIAERRAASPGADWGTFCDRNPDLFRAGDTLRRYYSNERLQSALARRQFLLPDRAPAGNPL